MNNFLTVSEIRELTGFKGRTITGWIEDGYLKSVRGPSKKKPRHFVKREDLVALLVKMKMPTDIISKIKKGA